MRYLLLVSVLAACGAPAGPRPNVAVTVTASATSAECTVIWTARADQHAAVPYYLSLNDATHTLLLTHSGALVDSITHGYHGVEPRPWDLVWNFFSKNDSLDHATIHTDCTAHVCGRVQSSC